jgi:hypothetical protein
VGVDLDWWLYGSAALAVRGLPVEPGDVDLNIRDSARAAELLDDLLVTPVLELERWAAPRVGRAFDGAIVEWISDPHPQLDDRETPHEHGPFVADRLETVEWRGHRIRVPPLAVQLAVCERRGLDGRARLIRAAVQAESNVLE